jgi:hypothetical protein
MTMKIKFLVSLILGVLPLTMMAQDDDMYFVPSKKSKVTTIRPVAVRPAPVYHSGSNRSVDEYNRRTGSSYGVLPTDTTAKNDVIDFNGEVGVYPDSTQQAEDFALTREMSRWDGYEPAVVYMEGYRDGRLDSWGWHSPWYYSYYPWYDAWYDPWYGYHGWYTGLYDSWYYDRWYYGYGYYGGYYGWGRPYYPYYYGPVHTVVYDNGRYSNRTHYDRRMVSSTRRGVTNGRTSTFSSGTFGGAAISNRQTATRSNRATSTTTNANTRVTNSHGTFAGNRTLPTPTTTTTSSSNRSAGTFGGGVTRSSSSSFGGGGGGGSFGGASTRGGSRSSRR